MCEDIDWVQMIQDRDQWMNLVISVLNLQVSCKGKSLFTNSATVSNGGFGSMELGSNIDHMLWRILRHNRVYDIENRN